MAPQKQIPARSVLGRLPVQSRLASPRHAAVRRHVRLLSAAKLDRPAVETFDSLANALARIELYDCNEMVESSQETLRRPEARMGGLAADRRRFPRHESSAVVRVYLLGERKSLNPIEREWRLHSTPLRGQLADVSMSGVALLMDESVPSGTHLWLRFSKPIDKSIERTIRVVNVIPQDSGQWQIVGELLQRLSLAEVTRLGEAIFASDCV